MKTFVIWLILFVALIGTILFLVSTRTGGFSFFSKAPVEQMATTTPPLSFDQATVYTCAGGEKVAAAFKSGDTSVLEVSLPNENPLILNQTEAASGARYAHENGTVFWEKGGEVLVEKAGQVVYANCKVATEVVPEAVASSTNELSGTQWVWIETSFATGTSVEPNEPEDFIITFAENNRFSANTDCNNVGGAFVGGNDGAVSFADIVSTLMACEGDVKEGEFTRQLQSVVSYKIDGSDLTLSIKSDAETGEMKFSKK